MQTYMYWCLPGSLHTRSASNRLSFFFFVAQSRKKKDKSNRPSTFRVSKVESGSSWEKSRAPDQILNCNGALVYVGMYGCIERERAEGVCLFDFWSGLVYGGRAAVLRTFSLSLSLSLFFPFSNWYHLCLFLLLLTLVMGCHFFFRHRSSRVSCVVDALSLLLVQWWGLTRVIWSA